MQKTKKLIEIEELIAKAANLSVEEISGRSREKEAVEARHIAWFIAHDYLRYTYLYIARMYGRDHTTIMYGVEKMRDVKMSKKIIEKIENAVPGIFEGSIGAPRPMESWKFAEEKAGDNE